MTFDQDKSEHDKIKQDNNTEQMLFRQYFYSLSTDEQYLYSQLVKREDPELYAWITGAADPEDAFKELIDKIKQSALKTV
jgi:succinate dehydrogenase flavin-adding protein (antitoxin of CptAB toxin-antitoxin module)